VTAPSGTGPFTFVWTKNGQVIGGETTDRIIVNSVTSADAGTYAVHVTGTCNTVDVSATLTVSTNASATALTSLVLCPGQPATFTTIASGTGPLTFIWKKDGVVQNSTSNSLTVASVTSTDAGTYTIEVYGICTSATNSATLTVNSNTSATALANQVRCPGDSAVFNTVASGTGPFSYVWRKNGNLLSGETKNSLTISSVTSANAGLYSVEVSGTCTIVTNSASLTVNTNVSATALSDAIVCPGSTTTFSTVASGTGPFGYVWKKNGNIISGQTTSALTLAQVTTNDSATYTIEVGGTCSAVTNSATLLVSTLATTPLNNLVGCQNQPITFATTVMANSPATYVWKKNGNVIAGATTNTYTINSAQTSDAGTYSVEVTSACLSATNTATLTMNSPTTASALIGQTRCPGQSATYSTVASGSGPFTYVWKQNGQVLPGQTGSSITLASLVNSNSGTYTVEVAGSCNTVTNSATLTVKTNVSTSALGDLVVCSGQPAVFTTTASGTAPFSYRWRKNGVVISGATTSSYTIASTSAANAGSYSVEVTGSCNTATNFGTLNISTAPTIVGLADQNICIGDTATFAIAVSGTGPFTYQWRFNGNIVAGQTTNTLVLPNLPVSANVVTVEVNGPCSGATNSANLTVWNNVAPSNGVLHVTNSDAIRINDNQPATPYPSTIFVRCVPSQLKKITVTLNAISHNYPSDIDVMLVSPAGRALVVMSHCGGDTPANGATITFDDDAPATLSPDSFLGDGTFKVSSYWTSPYFPTPAPTPNAIALRDLVTDDPSGSWSLYVLDDEPLDDGYIADGWTLNLYYANLSALKFINSTYLADGTFQTTLIGTEGITHTIQSSTDLIHWTTVTNSTLPGGSCTITVPTAANGRMQYYRAFRTE
jgi:subtilisin-like proprotein convertase family protein